ncbi:protein OXIDATIVE STRESS 3 LIKE 2-like [Bidens hawaiensis]|uniref:protein OXIDATIVE STRESS 3 LIKE 2-like n=1 Tax=Bidens hawaiensis TaxID=980011 RepID=UPI00404BA380
MMMILPEEEEEDDECNSSSSSSIGDDSDANADLEDDAESQNDNIFDDAIQALEQALPIRRGISTFYNGKSKSFTCLADVWPTFSVQDIAKPENAYTRKRKNLGAFKLSSIHTGQIRKKPKTSRFNFTIQKEDPNFSTHASQPQINRPLAALRSFSMVNLH